MKRILLLALVLSLGLNLVAQEKADTIDIWLGKRLVRIVKDGETTIKMQKTDDGDWEELYEEDILSQFEDDDDRTAVYTQKRRILFDGNWAGFELGLNNYVDKDFSFSRTGDDAFMDLNTGKSWNVNINVADIGINLYKGKVGLVSGIGFEFFDYKFDDNSMTLAKENGVVVPDYATYADMSLMKTKITMSYLTVPFLLEWQIPVGSNDIVVNGGVVGGMKLGSHTKVVYKEGGNRQKDKVRDDFNLSPFRYGFTARIGYNDWKLYATYYAVPLFEEDKGPELFPVAAGISLSF
ncbi:MAG: outer membrane beta-barrel protein [Bacteroidales bacterium]